MCLVQPDSRYWKIVLIGRKLSLALAAILLSYDAALQAGVAASVLFMAYILQQRRSPFLVDDAARAQLELEEERGSSSTSGSGDGVVRSARGCIIMMARKLVTSLPNYNTLESTFLVASMLILLAGMVFISNGFGVGSIGYNVLTWCVASVIGGATVTFVGLVVVEVYRSIRHSKQHVADRAREAEALEQAMKVRRMTSSTSGTDTGLSTLGDGFRRVSTALQSALTTGSVRSSTREGRSSRTTRPGPGATGVVVGPPDARALSRDHHSSLDASGFGPASASASGGLSGHLSLGGSESLIPNGVVASGFASANFAYRSNRVAILESSSGMAKLTKSAVTVKLIDALSRSSESNVSAAANDSSHEQRTRRADPGQLESLQFARRQYRPGRRTGNGTKQPLLGGSAVVAAAEYPLDHAEAQVQVELQVGVPDSAGSESESSSSPTSRASSGSVIVPMTAVLLTSSESVNESTTISTSTSAKPRPNAASVNGAVQVSASGPDTSSGALPQHSTSRASVDSESFEFTPTRTRHFEAKVATGRLPVPVSTITAIRAFRTPEPAPAPSRSRRDASGRLKSYALVRSACGPGIRVGVGSSSPVLVGGSNVEPLAGSVDSQSIPNRTASVSLQPGRQAVEFAATLPVTVPVVVTDSETALSSESCESRDSASGTGSLPDIVSGSRNTPVAVQVTPTNMGPPGGPGTGTVTSTSSDSEPLVLPSISVQVPSPVPSLDPMAVTAVTPISSTSRSIRATGVSRRSLARR